MNQEAACRQSVTVRSKTGLHLRPISLIVEVVRRSNCQVTISKGTHTVNADNVLDLMTLNAEFGTTLELEARGDGAAQVIAEIIHLFETGFEDSGEPSA